MPPKNPAKRAGLATCTRAAVAAMAEIKQPAIEPQGHNYRQRGVDRYHLRGVDMTHQMYWTARDEAKRLLRLADPATVANGRLKLVVVPGKGVGLFAATCIRKGTMVCAYGGVIREKAKHGVDFERSYSKRTCDGRLADGWPMYKLLLDSRPDLFAELEATGQRVPKTTSLKELMVDMRCTPEQETEAEEVYSLPLTFGCGFMANHSWDANVTTRLFPNNQSPHLFFYARRTIHVGEEITLNYHWNPAMCRAHGVPSSLAAEGIDKAKGCKSTVCRHCPSDKESVVDDDDDDDENDDGGDAREEVSSRAPGSASAASPAPLSSLSSLSLTSSSHAERDTVRDGTEDLVAEDKSQHSRDVQEPLAATAAAALAVAASSTCKEVENFLCAALAQYPREPTTNTYQLPPRRIQRPDCVKHILHAHLSPYPAGLSDFFEAKERGVWFVPRGRCYTSQQLREKLVGWVARTVRRAEEYAPYMVGTKLEVELKLLFCFKFGGGKPLFYVPE